MCGITGLLHFNDTCPDVLSGMNAALAHRGPDAGGSWVEGPVGLGHRRLSIIDLSDAGRQPMHSADGRYVMVYNGELYNYRELRAELTDYPFSTQTDSEVLLAAYARWGANCLDRLKGMFGLAIWDRQAQSLFVARDRLGIKPVYYAADANKLVFASEVRALLASGLVPGRLDETALADYLRYQTVHAPDTLLVGVRLLPPGCYLRVSAAGQREEVTYWRPRPADLSFDGAPAWQEAVRAALTAAVERRLVADVPFGAFLSGGIDSSAIVALMRQVMPGLLKTFSVTFAEEAFSEARYARQIARKFDTEHHEIKLSPGDFLKLLPEALSAMDHPSGDGPNTYVVSQATKAAGISMALSGLGGDELFGGYSIFRQAGVLERWGGLPRPLRALGASAMARLRKDIAGAKMATLLRLPRLDALTAYPLYRQVLLDAQIGLLLPGFALPPNWVAQLAQSLAQQPDFQQLPLLSRISVLEMQTYMANVLLRDTDQMSMAHALEVRVPFLDHELVELALAAPDAVKYPHSPKQLLVASLGELLPPEIVNRPKMGFTLPFEQWMKAELRDFCQERLEQLGQRAPFDPKALRRLWAGFLAGQPGVSWSRLWTLVVLANWLDQNRIT